MTSYLNTLYVILVKGSDIKCISCIHFSSRRYQRWFKLKEEKCKVERAVHTFERRHEYILFIYFCSTMCIIWLRWILCQVAGDPICTFLCYWASIPAANQIRILHGSSNRVRILDWISNPSKIVDRSSVKELITELMFRTIF